MTRSIFIGTAATLLVILPSCSNNYKLPATIKEYNSFESCWKSGSDQDDKFSAYLVVHRYTSRKTVVEVFSTKCNFPKNSTAHVSQRFLIGFNPYTPALNESQYFGDGVVSNLTMHLKSDPMKVLYAEGYAKHSIYGSDGQLILKLVSFSKIEPLSLDANAFIEEQLGMSSH